MSFIGIDVAKAQLEFACRPSDETGVVPNDERGIRELVVRCQALTPTLIVCEATGGYEAALVAALAAAPLPVVVTNPRQVRDFAKAMGQLAKTDAIDAQVLALFAERVRPEPRALPDEAREALDALLTRRRQLVEMLTAEKNRLLVARAPVRHDLQQHIRTVANDWRISCGLSSPPAHNLTFHSALTARSGRAEVRRPSGPAAACAG